MGGRYCFHLGYKTGIGVHVCIALGSSFRKAYHTGIYGFHVLIGVVGMAFFSGVVSAIIIT